MSKTTAQRQRYASRIRVTSALVFLIIPVIILFLAGRGVVAVPGEGYVAGSEGRGIEKAAESTPAAGERSTPIQSHPEQDILSHSVAVLPFKNLSPGRKDAYLAAGIHKEILSQLARIPGLNIIARPSVLKPAYVNGSMPVPAIAADLNVATIMTGSVYYAGDKVRVTAQLFNGKSGARLWSDFFDGSLTGISVFQAKIASRIAGAAQVGFPPEIRSSINKQSAQSPAAYALYLKALALVPDAGSRIPIEYYQYLEQAITLDPGFAMAHAAMAFGLGNALSYGVPIKGFSLQTMEQIALAHIAIVMETGTEIDMAYMAQAFIHWAHQRGTPARQAFERAMQLSPNNAGIMAGYARFLSFVGDHDAAVKLARRAVALAPGDPASHYLLAQTLVYAGKPAAAAESVRRSITLLSSSVSSHLLLGEIEYLLSNHEAAKSELGISEHLSDPGSVSMEDMSILIYAYSRMGLEQEALRVFDHFNARVATGEYVSTSALALAYLAIGDRNITFDLLNRSPNEGIDALQHIKSNILADPALETSRFQELRRRMVRLTGGNMNLSTPPF